ncbi:unnamed protein product [Fusarium equiseti]|uniref:Uncharacterized protein n=1 Tax=Fusarium equiseti TaxID=61235 RepID=A0A8J2NF66_FUSEQ|nr:unnamed protein product [Fusarium equiseti]
MQQGSSGREQPIESKVDAGWAPNAGLVKTNDRDGNVMETMVNATPRSIRLRIRSSPIDIIETAVNTTPGRAETEDQERRKSSQIDAVWGPKADFVKMNDRNDNAANADFVKAKDRDGSVMETAMKDREGNVTETVVNTTTGHNPTGSTQADQQGSSGCEQPDRTKKVDAFEAPNANHAGAPKRPGAGGSDHQEGQRRLREDERP